MVDSKLIWIDSRDKIQEIRKHMYFGRFLAIAGTILMGIILLGVGLWYLSILFLLFLILMIWKIRENYPEPLEIYTDKLVYWLNITSSMENYTYKKRVVYYRDIEYIGNIQLEETKIPIINEKVVKKWFLIKLKNGKEIILSGRYVTQIILAQSQLKKAYEYYHQYSRL